MAYAPIPNLVTIHAPKIGSNQLSMNTLTEILQSESVKRLLNRQNVYLQTPLTDGSVASDLASSRNSLHDRRNDSLSNDRSEKIPELSVIPLINYTEKEQTPLINSDDKHLLPSKNDGKSSVALLPLKRERRSCGHSEPCESIVCNVEFQQTFENDDIIPLIAINIDSSEIDAPVSRHCANDKCDALSIDHDLCRRAVIRCHRCDRTNTCDICLATLKTRKSQMMHKSCKMRVEYRHNKTSRGQLMRDRMRVRELQILDDARINKNDYTDPMTGHERAIESLQKNSELIVIPKASTPFQQQQQQRSTIRITAISGPSMTNNNISGCDTFGKFVPHYPLVLPGRRMLVKKSTSMDSTDHVISGKSMTNNDLTFSPISSPTNQFITINTAGNYGQSVNINDYLQTQSQTSSTGQLQSASSYLMPIRVVPIAGLKTEPSLLHQTHGVPKFCLVSQTPNQSATFAKTPMTILPAVRQQQQQQPIDRICIKPVEAGENKITRKIESSSGEFVLKRFKHGVRRGRRKKNGPKRGSKSFECTFCFKRFSTDWYFKLHIAQHKGEIKFTCKFCKKPFMHDYNMTKHIVTMHKQEIADDDSYVKVENGEFLHCSICKIIFETKIEMESHRCPVVCLRCHTRILDGDLTRHLRTKHAMSEEQVIEEYVRQKRLMVQNRVRKNQSRAGRKRDETRERENGAAAPKRKRTSLISNDARGQRDVGSNDQMSMKIPVRRLRRRRNHSLVEQLVNSTINKNHSEIREHQSMPEFTLSSIAADTELVSR